MLRAYLDSVRRPIFQSGNQRLAQRILRIRNTMHLDEMDVSEPCLAEPERQSDFAPMGQPRPLEFDAAGNLPLL